MTTTRRTFLTGAAAAGAALAAPGLVRAQATTLKLSTFLPPQHQIVVELNRWADELRGSTGGALDIEVFPAAQMGPPPRQYDLARTGVADMAFVFTAFTPGRFKATDALTLPYVLADDEGAAMPAATCSAIATTMKPERADEYVGTELLYDVCTPSLGFFMREVLIERPEQLEGLRVRPSTPITADELAELGASPATIAPAEVADAIAKGVVDGAIFNFEGGAAFGLQTSVRHVSMTPLSAGVFSLVANRGALEKLPEELRAAIAETTGVDAARRVGGLYDDAEVAGREKMEAAGVEAVYLDGERGDAFREALEPVKRAQLAAIDAAGIDAAAILARIETLRDTL